MRCFYHGTDLDGQCSAAIVKSRYNECDLIPIDHGQYYPWGKIPKDEVVYVVDFTIQPFELMLDLPSSLVWIDHHKAAIESDVFKNFNPLGHRELGSAACELTWKWCYPEKSTPLFVSLLGRYDVGDHSWIPGNNGWLPKSSLVLSFQYGMRAINTHPSSIIWNDLLQENNEQIVEIVEDGMSILRYVNKFDERYSTGYSFESSFEEYSCICCNMGAGSPNMLDQVWDSKRHDLQVHFCRTNDKRWKVNIFTKKEEIDCGEIATRYGGGGHSKAAGFHCKKLPFKI